MFSPSGGGGRATPPRAPPDRGANVVVTMRSDDARCVRLQKALYLLGTYYNLFVLVDCASSSSRDFIADDADLRRFVRRIQSELLNEDDDVNSRSNDDDDDEHENDRGGGTG